MHRPLRALTLGLTGLVASVGAAGCAGSATPSTAPAVSVAAPTTAALPSMLVTLAPPTAAPATQSPSLAPAATNAAPALAGDAATNRTCAIATVAEIETAAGKSVVGIRGLTTAGAYGKKLYSCAWYLAAGTDPGEVGSPSVVVQWEYPVTTFHDPVVDLYRLIVDQKLATRVKGVGDYAVLQGRTAEAIDGKHIVRSSVLLHADATPEDQDKAVQLLRMLLARAVAS